MRKHRKEISNHGNFFLLTDKGDSILDGYYIGFAFEAKELGKLIKYFWYQQTGKYDSSQLIEERKDGKFITKLLPIEERYSGRFFNVKDIFNQLDPERPTLKVEMEWYYDISSWENLCIYLSSEERKKMLRPKLPFFKYKTWNKIGEDEENS